MALVLYIVNYPKATYINIKAFVSNVPADCS